MISPSNKPIWGGIWGEVVYNRGHVMGICKSKCAINLKSRS
jgi:hypothetical protein